MLGALFGSFWCPLNCDVAFKITNRLKVNNDNLKFNDNLKVTSQLGGHQKNIRKTFSISLYIYIYNVGFFLVILIQFQSNHVYCYQTK
jgi:hypothetical protein